MYAPHGYAIVTSVHATVCIQVDDVVATNKMAGHSGTFVLASMVRQWLWMQA